MQAACRNQLTTHSHPGEKAKGGAARSVSYHYPLYRSRLPELQIVAEASEGIEAVQKAWQLQPSLILLDIGLPKLNGIAAARQIRELAPQSKIVFVTQETSADIVKEAIGLGAMGYVVKTKVQSELLKAIDSVLEGKQFISSGLTGSP